MKSLRLTSVPESTIGPGVAVGRDDALLAASGALFVAASALSGSDLVSTTLASAAILAGVGPVARRFRTSPATQLASAVAAFWLVYGLAVGSLPSPADPGALFRWGSTEGRAFIALYAIAVGASFRSGHAVVRLVRWVTLVITVSLVLGAVSHVLHIGPPLYEHRPRKLFHGLTSSHHVAGFLGAAAVIIVAAMPRQFSVRARVAVVAVGLAAVGWSASRTALVGLTLAAIVMVGHLVRRRHLAMAVGGLVLVLALLVPVVPRFRQTVDIVTRPEFASEVVSAFQVGTTRNARRLSDSGVEGNILIRFALWGAEFDEIRRSPLVGIGRFRGDDIDAEFSGVDGLLLVVLDAERRHSHAEPHNMYIYVLGETGLIGLALFAMPYAWVVRRTRWRSPSGNGRRTGDGPGSVGGEEADGGRVTADPAGAASEVLANSSSSNGRVNVGWSHWIEPRTEELPRRESWRALSRGMLAFGLAGAMVSAGLLTTGLGLVVNLTVFASAACFRFANATTMTVEPGASA